MVIITQYTQEQRSEYFKNLRQRWGETKKLAQEDQKMMAMYHEALKTVSGKFSYWSFYFVAIDMKANGFEGTPYIDCKTFKGWKNSGFIVKRGEKSKISGIVWLQFGKDQEGNTTVGDEVSDDEVAVYPKLYHLFHKSQVEPI